LFVLGADGRAQLVNYRVRGRYYVVDRLFAAADLRLGEKPQQVVRIARSDIETPVVAEADPPPSARPFRIPGQHP
jgi:type IV secretion system protein VirB9